ncbi:MarR family transcriptional regulator [Ancylobacter aquaticus]|uniref:MarR family transcriptional regulator n=1 Tax=Ancylobacter aquaticus TaxID=100 RepID=A0A4R1IH33_ANCAQ|nr:MarR family winged helix-turn-helix transcriptional regulator [Ancylobacter aquaticus]TCK30722.1 MarR family transcriptional regulator [Ancylobacter aquaticus]
MNRGGPDQPGGAGSGRSAGGDAAYRLDDQVGFLMRVASQRHTALFAARMIEGLTPPQFATLARLREIGPCSQNHLGRLVHLDAATIKGVVDRLQARDLLVIGDDPLDRRRRAVDLSVRGREVADAAVLVAGEISAATLEPLTPTEREQAVRLLRKLG